MTLKFVTFNDLGEQFLVKASTDKKAIELAHETNRKFGDQIDDDLNLSDLNDENYEQYYEVENVNFELLCELFKRPDYLFHTSKVIVFAGA